MPANECFQSLLRIRPQPVSSVYTTALLAKVKAAFHIQDFSRVHRHQHQHDKACSLFKLQFESEPDQHKATQNSPMVINIAFGKQQKEPSPSSPYGLKLEQPRYVPPAQSFTCTLEKLPNAGSSCEPHRDERLVEDAGSQPLHDALTAAGAPPNLIPGLAMRPAGSGLDSSASKAQRRR
jgi:hypothetical protein